MSNLNIPASSSTAAQSLLALVKNPLKDAMATVADSIQKTAIPQPAASAADSPPESGTAPAVTAETGAAQRDATAVDLPPIPEGPEGESFKSGMLRMIQGVDAQIDYVKGMLTGGTLKPEEMLTWQLELQGLLQLKSQLTQMLTDTMKSEHDMAMAVIRNLAV